MTWVRLDDAAPDHHKLVGLDDEAFAMWIRALCYCARSQSDGKIARAALRRLTAARKPEVVAARLVVAGLWKATEDGYEVHDFLEYNPSAEQNRTKREARAAAGRLGGKRSGEMRAGRSNGEADAKQEGEAKCEAIASGLLEPRPVPSPPDPDQHTHFAGAREAVPAPPPTLPESAIPFGDGARHDAFKPGVDHPDPAKSSGKTARATTPSSPASITPIPPSASEDQQLPTLIQALSTQPSIAASASTAPAGDIVAIRGIAEVVLGRMLAGGKRLEDVLRAIGEAGADLAAEPGVGWARAAKVVRAYTDAARRPDEQPKGPVRLGRGGVQQQPAGGPLYDPGLEF